jgi:hypothetical protein
MYVRKSSKKRKYLIVKLLGTSSSDRSLYVFRCRCSGCINRWDVLINFPKSYLPPIRGYSWHKNEIKKLRRGHYSTNNFQDLTKGKLTEKKTLGYLPRVLFFNAFELGAVILKDAHVCAIKELEAKEIIKRKI